MEILNDLVSKGYKFAYVKRGAKTRIWVTKDSNVTDNSDFDEWAAETEKEKVAMKQIVNILDKGVLINLLG